METGINNQTYWHKYCGNFNRLSCSMEKTTKNTFGILILIFLVIIVFSGCEKFELGEPYDCKIGTKYKVTSDITFSIDSIIDSRCPRDMLCFWSGDVILYFNIDQNNTHIDTAIYLYNSNRNPIQLEDYKWEVLEVNPWRRSDQNISQKDYRIKLLIEKLK
jgi:hypothetical protein